MSSSSYPWITTPSLSTLAEVCQAPLNNHSLSLPLQKCVKQLCVYHPRLQALKLSNRTKLTYDEQHISQETLSHLGTSLPTPADEAIDLGCGDSREHMEEVDSPEGIDQGDEVDDVTEGEDSNATIHVSGRVECFFHLKLVLCWLCIPLYFDFFSCFLE